MRQSETLGKGWLKGEGCVKLDGGGKIIENKGDGQKGGGFMRGKVVYEEAVRGSESGEKCKVKVVKRAK